MYFLSSDAVDDYLKWSKSDQRTETVKCCSDQAVTRLTAVFEVLECYCGQLCVYHESHCCTLSLQYLSRLSFLPSTGQQNEYRINFRLSNNNYVNNSSLLADLWMNSSTVCAVVTELYKPLPCLVISIIVINNNNVRRSTICFMHVLLTVSYFV